MDDFTVDIMRKVVEKILSQENSYSMLLDIGEGVVTPEIMERLEKGMKAFLSEQSFSRNKR